MLIKIVTIPYICELNESMTLTDLGNKLVKVDAYSKYYMCKAVKGGKLGWLMFSSKQGFWFVSIRLVKEFADLQDCGFMGLVKQDLFLLKKVYPEIDIYL